MTKSICEQMIHTINALVVFGGLQSKSATRWRSTTSCNQYKSYNFNIDSHVFVHVHKCIAMKSFQVVICINLNSTQVNVPHTKIMQKIPKISCQIFLCRKVERSIFIKIVCKTSHKICMKNHEFCTEIFIQYHIKC